MALRALKIQAELKVRSSNLANLVAQKSEFDKRKYDLAAALEEAESQDDINLVQSQIDELDKEITEADTNNKILSEQAEVDKLNSELVKINTPASDPQPEPKPTENNERGANIVNKYQVRELIKTGAYYERSEVKKFYDDFKQLRSVGGEGLTIPEVIINRIMDIVGDSVTLYPLINTIMVKGTARILIDTDTSAATWVEMTGTLPVGTVGTITNVDFDGYKIGKVTFVDNSILQDSIVNLDDYVTRKLARAIALGLNLAILKGTGSSDKQPTGIIPSLSVSHKTEADVSKLVNVIKKISLIDSGDDSVGEIVCVMKRSTYYNRFLEFSINTDSAGNVVGKLPNLSNPDILGLRVIFSNNMDEDTVLFGEFDKYTLVERESVTVSKSEHVKFTEDQMAYRGVARFDGKPTKPDAFVAINLDLGVLQSLTIASAAGTASGDTKITITETKMLGRTYQYKTHATIAPTAAYGDVLSGWTAWNGSADITVTTGYKISVCEVGTDGKVKRLGSATVTSKA